MHMQTTWLQAGEVARRLGVTPQSVRNWAKAGRLLYSRTNEGTFIFSSDDVEAFRAADSWPGVLIKSRVWGELDGYDGRELGGFLIGRDLGDRIVVEAIAEQEHAERSWRSISLDLRRIPEIERGLAPGVGVVGDYHGHDADASGFASARDKQTWVDTAATLRQTWLGVIVHEPTSPGQVENVITAYLTRDGETHWIGTPVRI